MRMKWGGMVWLMAVVLFVGMPLASSWAGEDEGGEKPKEENKKPEKKPKKEKPPRRPSLRGFNLPYPQTINRRLGAEMALTDEQKQRVNEAREGIKKKLLELLSEEKVKAAKAEVEKVREALKAAEGKLKEAMGGYNPMQEYRKALAGILTEEQVAKALPKKRKRSAKRERKPRKPKDKGGKKKEQGAGGEGG